MTAPQPRVVANSVVTITWRSESARNGVLVNVRRWSKQDKEEAEEEEEEDDTEHAVNTGGNEY